MSKKPSFAEFDELFRMKKFELTDSEYEKKTGVRLPKDKYYLLNNSAIAKKCREHGYKLTLIEKRIICTKENA